MLRVPLDPYGAHSDSALEALAVIAVHLAASRHIVGALGAGVSTSAGIPDFRGARGGLYGARSAASPTSDLSTTRDPQLAAFRTSATKHLFSYAALVQPESRKQHLQLLAALKKHVRRATRPSKPSRKGKERAEPLAAECPTAFHSLLKSLEERGQLLRVYSQNIDGLERAAGLSAVDLVTSGGDGDGGASGDESSSDYERSHVSVSPKRRSPARAGPSQRVERKAHEHDGTVVALHGTLKEVLCGVCGWREKWRKEHTRSFRKGKTVDCSQCYERAASRRRRSKRMIRPSPLAFLRPAVLLYDDPHSFASSASSRISSIASADLAAAPDLLLVAGTSLKIPGFKRLVKEFAKRVYANGGLCVLVNREPVGKEWDGVFDYHILGDTDAFAIVVQEYLDVLVEQAGAPASPSRMILPLDLQLSPLSPTPSFASLSLPPTPPASSPPWPPVSLPQSAESITAVSSSLGKEEPTRPCKRQRTTSPSPARSRPPLPTPPPSFQLLPTVPLPSPSPSRRTTAAELECAPKQPKHDIVEQSEPRPAPHAPASSAQRAHKRPSGRPMGIAELLQQAERIERRVAREKKRRKEEKRRRRREREARLSGIALVE